MSKRTVVQVFCDMPHTDETPAETTSINVGRETIEVDLCPAHEAELILPLRTAGRVARKPGRKPRAAAPK